MQEPNNYELFSSSGSTLNQKRMFLISGCVFNIAWRLFPLSINMNYLNIPLTILFLVLKEYSVVRYLKPSFFFADFTQVHVQKTVIMLHYSL